MTDKKISELNALTGAAAAVDDLLAIVDITVDETKKITRQEFFTNIPSLDINGGTVDGTVIGGTVPAAISGTTGSFSGNLTTGGAFTVSGITSVADGSALNPAIRFSNDIDTGIYRSAANAISFAVSGFEAATFVDSGGTLLQVVNSIGTMLFQVSDSSGVNIGASYTPLSAADTGAAGQIAWDSSYIYICTATNTWKRVAIATW
jgi:hypothetical protein